MLIYISGYTQRKTSYPQIKTCCELLRQILKSRFVQKQTQKHTNTRTLTFKGPQLITWHHNNTLNCFAIFTTKLHFEGHNSLRNDWIHRQEEADIIWSHGCVQPISYTSTGLNGATSATVVYPLLTRRLSCFMFQSLPLK